MEVWGHLESIWGGGSKSVIIALMQNRIKKKKKVNQRTIYFPAQQL